MKWIRPEMVYKIRSQLGLNELPACDSCGKSLFDKDVSPFGYKLVKIPNEYCEDCEFEKLKIANAIWIRR